MRALAEFAMRSRGSAIVTVLLCSFVPLVNPGLVALVTLRRGPIEGLLIGFWALLIFVVLAFIEVRYGWLAFVYLSMLVAAIGGANVLRNTLSWPFALLGVVVISVTGGLIHQAVFVEQTAELLATIAEDQAQLIEQMGPDSQGQAVQPVEVTPSLWNGLIAVGIGFNAILGLLLGRWWQSVLYNPGGFRQEFYQLRLSQLQSLAWVGLTALAVVFASEGWVMLLSLPLLLVTTAVMHQRIHSRKQGTVWLVLYYLVLITANIWMVLLLAVFGASDAWLNYRALFAKNKFEKNKPAKPDTDKD